MSELWAAVAVVLLYRQASCGRLEPAQAMLNVKGLLEMMFEVLSGWIEAFIGDMEGLEATDGLTPPPSGSTTPRAHTPTGAYPCNRPGFFVK